jgi:SAM-dependent methyltransferase
MFSRFGVMFFTDPAAAFSNIRQAIKPGGRLTFVCWGPVAENSWVTVPLSAARSVLPDADAPDPRAPGPFAFADKDYVTDILSKAGFANIGFKKSQHPITIAEGTSPAESAGYFLDVGPVSRALAGQPDSMREAARAAIQEAIAPFHYGHAVNLQGTCWIVTADTT